MAKVHENKQAFAAIIIAALLIVGAVFAFTNASKPKPGEMSDIDKENQASSNKTQDIMSILKGGKDLQCNFEYFENEDKSTAGVVYVSGDNVRFDATTFDGAEDSDIFMIRKGNNNYIWGTSFPKNSGLLMESTLDELFANPQAKQYLNADKYEYGCRDWRVDLTAFDLPQDVKFTDLMGLMRQMISPTR